MSDYDVFISYSSKDINIAYELAKCLKQDGLRVWFDKWVINPVDSILNPVDYIPLKIREGLRKSHTLLMCMSPAYFESEWGRMEHHTLIFRDPTNEQRSLIPLLIADCTLPDIIAHLAYIDWRTCSDEAYGEILTCCRENNSERSSTNLIEQKLREEERRKKEKEALEIEILEEEKAQKEKEEAERKQREEEERKKIEETERKQREEEERKKREEQERKKKEVERSMEEFRRKKREKAEKLETQKKLREEQERKQREEAEKKLKEEFVLIPAGKFIMGSHPQELGRSDNEGLAHVVKIENSFYMGKYPVTQKQWEKVMGFNPSYFTDDDLPVEGISWISAQDFILKLNEKESKYKFRLPSEAEWEYACRAGTKYKYFFGDDKWQLGDYAWYEKNSGSQVHPVGQKKPNSWGLYDMHGNVLEWCQDRWHNNYIGAPYDGSSWEDGNNSSARVLRGGGYNFRDDYCRSASRFNKESSACFRNVGFRLVMEDKDQLSRQKEEAERKLREEEERR